MQVTVVGYARVSTRGQHPESQTDALAAAGCEKTFTEHASGTLARRPALDEALSYLRAGDTLVVTKLDRLGRSVRNLKQIADDLQARQVGLRAVSQGIEGHPRDPAAAQRDRLSAHQQPALTLIELRQHDPELGRHQLIGTGRRHAPNLGPPSHRTGRRNDTPVIRNLNVIYFRSLSARSCAVATHTPGSYRSLIDSRAP